MLSKDTKKQGKTVKRQSYSKVQSAAKTHSRVSSPYRKELSRFVKLANAPIDRTLKYRHELKYVISYAKTEAITRYIEPYLELDRYSRLRPDGFYPIVSLYLDSDNLQLCRESIDGNKNRFKLRIRSYTDDPEYPRFMEIKRRINLIIAKDRVKIKDGDIPRLLRGMDPAGLGYQENGNIISQFQLYAKSIMAHPTVLIRYRRRAYEGYSHNRVRVTFDRELCYKSMRMQQVTLNGAGWQRHNIQGVILEIKFTGRYPAWLGRMTECFDLRVQSMSKYASSIKNACLLGFCAPEVPIVEI